MTAPTIQSPAVCGKCGAQKRGPNCPICSRKSSMKYYWRHRSRVSAARKVRRANWTPKQRERARAGSRRFYKRHRKEFAAAYARRTRQSASKPDLQSQLATIKANGCFRCDGTKQLCNVCGESARACQCPEDERSFYQCPDCKASAETTTTTETPSI